MNAVRPAFYALAPGGWRDYVTLLHLPYTAWHLSYVAIGASLAPVFEWRRLAVALAAFFLALGVAAHALDELNARPLGTRIPDRVLLGLAAASLAGAAVLAAVAAVVWTPWLFAFALAGVVLVVAYNLELLGGRIHTDNWFAIAWGAFPLLTGYFGCAERITAEAAVAALFAYALSRAQRRLSTQVRTVRRSVHAVSGEVVYRSGARDRVEPATLVAAPESALRWIALATVALATAMVVLRL